MIPPSKKFTANHLMPAVEPELAPPAEWLLLNANSGGTADPELLMEALVMEHYPALLQLAHALYCDIHHGQVALLDALAQAVQEAYRYPPQLSVRAWLAGFLLAGCPSEAQHFGYDANFTSESAAWRNFRRLPPPARLVLALELLLEWPPEEIERVPGLEDAAGQLLSDTERRILAQAFRSHVPATLLKEDELERLAQAAARRAANGADGRRRRAAFKEMVLIGITILGVVLVIFAANRLLPEEPAPASPGFPVFATPTPAQEQGSSELPVPTATAMWKNHVAYVVKRGDTVESVAESAGMCVDDLQRINGLARAETLYPGQPLWVLVPGFSPGAASDLSLRPEEPLFVIDIEPLKAGAETQEILDRLRQSRQQWQSLWMDLQMAYYGPKSYNAEPRAYRTQVWVDRQVRSLEIFNNLSNIPEMRHITLNGRSYTSAVRYSGSYLDGDWQHAHGVLLSNPLLRDMIFPGDSYLTSERAYITPGELGVVAGREALVVDWFFPANSWSFRLWIDTHLGIVLRRQHIEAATGYLISDLTATDIAIDSEFEDELFNPLQPWEGGFALNYLGERFPFENLPPTPTWTLPTQRPTLTD